MAILRNAFLLSVVCVAVFANNPKVLEGGDAIDGEYIVALKNVKTEQDLSKFRALVKGVDTASVKRTYQVGSEHFALVSVTNRQKINDVSTLSFVDFIESNGRVSGGNALDMTEVSTEHHAHVRHKRNSPEVNQEHCTASYMNDVGGDWGIVRTSHRNLPDPLSAPYIHGNDDGEGVDIYIVDSGIYIDHSDFEGRAWWGMTGDAVAAREAAEEDLNGSGTHVAGIAGGKMYGMARRANLIACKVLGSDGIGEWADIVHALEWIVQRIQWQKAVGMTPRSVINLSLGGEDLAYAAISAIQAAIEEGAVVSIAAGNLKIDACYYSPARLATALTVAATDMNDEFADFSNFGPCINIMAPGRNITGPWIGYDTRYVYISGTNMAAPHVAGIAARHLSMYSDNMVPTSMEIRADIIDETTRGMINLPGLAIGSTPNHLAYKACDSRPKPEIYTYEPQPEPELQQEAPFEWPEIPACPQIEKVNWPNDTIYTVLLGVLVLVCFALLQHIMLIVGLIRIKKRCKNC